MSNETNNDLRIKRLEQHIKALEERMAFLEGKNNPNPQSARSSSDRYRAKKITNRNNKK